MSIFPLFVFLLLAISPAYAETVIVPLQDAMVQNGTALNFNYGAAQYLKAGGAGTTIFRSFLMFNLSTLPSDITITSAVLSLYKYSGISSGTAYYLAYNTSTLNTTGTSNWNEGTGIVTNCGTRCNLDQNITWANQPAAGVLQDNISTSTTAGIWINFSVGNATITSSGVAGRLMSILIKASNESDGRIWIANSKESVSTDPYLTVTYTVSDCTNSCGSCGCDANSTGCYVPPIVGSYCDPLNNSVILTKTASCAADTFYVCPNSTVCSQITPQVNITSPLVENFVDCSVCWFAKIYSVQNGWKTLWTNCPNNPECDNCNGIYCQGNNFVTNLSSIPASANYYTAGCYNPSTQTVIDVVDENGTHTSVQNLTERVFPNSNYTYNGTCANTSTKCYTLIGGSCTEITCPGTVINNGATSGAGWFALSLGSLFGITDLSTSQWIFSMIVALGVGFALLYYTKGGEHGGQAFIFGTLAPLILFSLIGWFPGWVMILLIVAGAFLVARSLGVGG